MDLNLKDKVVMVAGASEGLGFGIAEQLAKEGAWVSISSRSQERIDSAKQRLLDQGFEKIIAHVADATDINGLTEWRDKTLNEWGDIYGLLINAGGPPPGRFDDFSDQDWQQGFELTLLSAVRMIRLVLPSMRTAKQGSIVAITSSSIKEPVDDLLLSNVFRSGVVSLLKSLSREVAIENIRINNLVPGRINTQRLQGLFQYMADKNQQDKAAIEQGALQHIPMGRLGEVDEFARAGTFLLSPAASYITGETFIVDGGLVKTVW